MLKHSAASSNFPFLSKNEYFFKHFSPSATAALARSSAAASAIPVRNTDQGPQETQIQRLCDPAEAYPGKGAPSQQSHHVHLHQQ